MRVVVGVADTLTKEYIDPLDPPPAYGLFAHVQLPVLEERVAHLGLREQAT